MKTMRSNQIYDKAADSDTIIGRALSRSLGKPTPDEQCPTAERMATLVDGGCADEERDNILSHLAVCDRCREVYILAHDLSKPETVRQGRRGWYMAGGALASAALVVLVVKLTIQQPTPSGPQLAQAPSAPQAALAPPAVPMPPAKSTHGTQPQPATFAVGIAARQLAQVTSADTLASAIGSPRSGSYGFAGSGSRQGTAFRAGEELFELELWLAAGDRERAGLAGERLVPLLRSLGGDVATAPLDDLLRQLENNEPLDRMEDITSQLETLLKTTDKGIVRLGSWASAAKVATCVGNDPYFAGNPPQRYLEEQGSTLSPAALGVLRNLEKKKMGNNPAELRRLLNELANAI